MARNNLGKKKKCTKCKETKPLVDFYKHKRGKYGHRSECIICLSLYVNKRRNTEVGFLKKRYEDIQTRAKIIQGDTKHQCYFTFKEYYNEFKKHKEKYGMRSAWGPRHLPMTMIYQGRKSNNGGRQKGQKTIKSNVSSDRLDSSKPYTIQNLIFIRNDENSRKKDTTYEDCIAQIKLHEERFVMMKAI